jgi:hypothetical protein
MHLEQTLWEFISNIQDVEQLDAQERKIICFVGFDSQYPQQLFVFLMRALKEQFKKNISFIDLCSTELLAFRTLLSMSFLGNSALYWLGNINTLSDKKLQEYLTYLSTYTGPHIILLYVSQEQKELLRDVSYVIMCEPVITVEQFCGLAHLNSFNAMRSITFFARLLMRRHKIIPLEIAFLLVRYASVLGRNSEQFIDDWLEYLVPSQESLFALSKSFFARDACSFYMQLAILEPMYTPVFWTTYWSEQLFRAYWFVRLKSAGATAASLGSIGQRLPFSFIERDWRSTSCIALKDLHAFVYTIDYELKNGGSPVLLELLYARYFVSAKH